MLLTVAVAGGAVKSGVVSGSAFSKFTLLVMKTEDENAPTCTPYMPDDFVFDMGAERCQAVSMKNEGVNSDIELQATVGDGKYTVTFLKSGHMNASRHGDKGWRDLTGDGLVLAMLQEIAALKQEIDDQRDVFNQRIAAYQA